jgi:hypothetical protein
MLKINAMDDMFFAFAMVQQIATELSSTPGGVVVS